MLFSLTKADFDQSQWQSVIDGSKQKTWLAYNFLFNQKVAATQAANDLLGEQVFAFLAEITAPVLLPGGKDFGPPGSFADLSKEQLDVLTELVDDVTDPTMRARIADILWSNKEKRRQDRHVAELAVDSYIAAARFYLEPTNLTNEPEYWIHAANHLSRAVRLAASLGKVASRGTKKTYFSTAIDAVEQALAQFQGEIRIASQRI